MAPSCASASGVTKDCAGAESGAAAGVAGAGAGVAGCAAGCATGCTVGAAAGAARAWRLGLVTMHTRKEASVTPFSVKVSLSFSTLPE